MVASVVRVADASVAAARIAIPVVRIGVAALHPLGRLAHMHRTPLSIVGTVGLVADDRAIALTARRERLVAECRVTARTGRPVPTACEPSD